MLNNLLILINRVIDSILNLFGVETGPVIEYGRSPEEIRSIMNGPPPEPQPPSPFAIRMGELLKNEQPSSTDEEP